jgi:hypothetical protein
LSSATVPGAVAGPVALTLPRASLFSVGCAKGWALAIVLRYQRRTREVNEAVVATYLAAPVPSKNSSVATILCCAK